MSTSFLQRLYDVLQADRLEKKILIADSFAQGHQWLERISREFGAVMNTDIQTVESLVLSHAKLELYQKGFKMMTSLEGFWMIYELMEEMSVAGKIAYVPAEMLSPGIIQCFYRAVQELRQAGIRARDLEPSHFESERKGNYVSRLLKLYEEHLSARKWADFAALTEFIRPIEQSTLCIAQAHMQLSFVQKNVLQKITVNRLMVLDGDCAFSEPHSAFPKDSCDFFHASGPLTEIREVFRRIAEKRIPWDGIEIIASDYRLYANAIYTIASQYGVECTFSQGLPLQYSPQGRAALTYLEWVESNFNLDVLVSGLKHGLIRLNGGSNNRLIHVMEKSGIGWGRERYLAWIKSSASEDNEEEENHQAELMLVRFFKDLLSNLPNEGEFSPPRLIQGLVAFLNSYTVCGNEHEHSVFNYIKQICESMKQLNCGSIAIDMTVRFVREQLENITFMPLTIQEPGKIHVSSLHDGGVCGRSTNFIVGMSEKAWTSTAVQDPVLSDEERKNLSPHLLVSGERARMQTLKRQSSLGMIRGSCTISFSSFDLTDNREIHPAYEMLKLFRNQSGQSDADFNDLFKHIKNISGFVISNDATTIDESDVWVSQLATPELRIRNGKSQVLAHYAHLAAGEQAVEERKNDPVSPYDGWIVPGRYPIDFVSGEESHLSVSKLELFARCPLQFFYKEVLGIRVKEIAVYDRTRWLDVLQRGNLLHDIYYLYYTDLQKRVEPDVVKHDYELLQLITDKVINLYLEQIPSPSPHILLKESDSIRRDVRIFYETEKHQPGLPKYMELPLHPENGSFMVELNEELSIPVKGYVDRVDEIAPHQYKIYDYKTGSPKKYKSQEYFSRGTQLQHALYAVAVEQRLKQTGMDLQAQVTESVYYFPTEKGIGDTVSRLQNRREDLASIIQSMLDAMKQGVFPPTHEPAYCTWCDYKQVCGNHAELMKVKRDLPENKSLLSAVAEVYSYD